MTMTVVGVWCGVVLAIAACDSSSATVDAAHNADATDDVDAKVDAGPTPFGAPPKQWTWIEIPGAYCRDGTPAGIAVNIDPASPNLEIFMAGGGECASAATCAANKSHWGVAELQTYLLSANALIDRSVAKNPFKDWSFILVPYCTGDLDAGNNPNATVPNVTGTQQFVGRINLAAFANRIAAELPAVTAIALSGCSAGAFGARFSFELVKTTFPQATVTTILDSGPALAAPYFPSALQDTHRQLWNYDATVLSDCGAACTSASDYQQANFDRLLAAYPNNRFALISHEDDTTLSSFWSLGPGVFTEGLLAHRAAMVQGNTNVGFYIIPGAGHCVQDLLPTTVVNGVPLTDWITDVVNGQISQVGP